MALRHDIEKLRERLKTAVKGQGLVLFAGVLIIFILALVAAGAALLHPKPLAGAALDGPTFCRQCAALSRLENAMTAALAKEDDVGSPFSKDDRARIVGEIAGWQRRCSTLLCLAPEKAGEGLACAAPSASLLSELAAIDALSASLSHRTALCAQGGCQSAQCSQASAATTAFANLDGELRALLRDPSALVGEHHQVASGFLFDQLGTLDEAVLAAPALIAGDRFAAAEARLLYLRDQAVDAESQSPDSAEGVIADRLGELSTAIEALAQGRRSGMSGPPLVALWQQFAESSSRLLVEASTLKAQTETRSNVFEAMIHPEALNVGAQGKVCEGTVRLVQATQQRVTQALLALSSCTQRAACTPAEDVGTTGAISQPQANGASLLDLLASGRAAATSALSTLSFEHDPQVTLTTDLAQYFSGEAIAVRALAENNRCLADHSSRLVLARGPGAASPAQSVEAHALDPADSAAWLFAAPQEPGTYRFVLDTSKDRGEGEFGASAVFAVSAPAGRTSCSGFSGRWQTDFGTLTLYVRDGIARGSYQRSTERPGLLVGSVDGSTLTGKWSSELGDGGARLTLGADGKSFQGTWSQYPDRYSGAGKWDGQCLPAAPSAPGH